MANDDMDRVIPIDELDDFEVAEGDPDVRGWEVRSADGRRIGEVDNLLVDTAAMKVRYLDVDLDDELVAGSNEDRHILIPIGYAQLDEEDDQVMVSSLNSTDIGALPAYSHEPVTREYETNLRRSFDRDYTAAPAPQDSGTDFYAHDLYDENRFYGSRRTVGSQGMDTPLSAGGAGEAPLGEVRPADVRREGDADLRRDQR